MPVNSSDISSTFHSLILACMQMYCNTETVIIPIVAMCITVVHDHSTFINTIKISSSNLT